MTKKNELQGPGNWSEYRLLVTKSIEDLQSAQEKTKSRVDKIERYALILMVVFGIIWGGKDLLGLIIKIAAAL